MGVRRPLPGTGFDDAPCGPLHRRHAHPVPRFASRSLAGVTTAGKILDTEQPGDGTTVPRPKLYTNHR